jgi:hypothetical protein
MNGRLEIPMTGFRSARVISLVGVLAVIVARPAAAQWTPPMGIPTPPFGISEQAPAPNIFVDEANGDDGNPCTAAKPCATIPRSLAAGSVVSVIGQYTFAHSSPNTIVANGTASKPVFIEGGQLTSGDNELSGTYVIVEKGVSGGLNIRDTPDGGPTHHVVVRDEEFTGGGVAFAQWLGGDMSYFVALRTYIHDVGDMNTTTDQDAHCVGVGGPAHHVWVLDSTFTRCSGDGLQVNGGSDANGPLTHHIYAGRNIAVHNRQSGFWAKQSTYVVFSTNVVSEMRPNSGGNGWCFGGQYAAASLVIVNNRCTNSEGGVGIMSYDDGAPGGVIVVDNTFWNIHHTTSGSNIQDVWSGGAAIFMAGGLDRYIVNNTIYDVDGGIQIAQSSGSVTTMNNIIAKATREYIGYESPQPTFTNTLFDVAPTIAIQGAATVESAALLGVSKDLIGNPLFTDPTSANFTLKTGSPAIHAGVAVSLDSNFQSIHGVPLGVTLTGTPNMGAIDPLTGAAVPVATPPSTTPVATPPPATTTPTVPTPTTPTPTPTTPTPTPPSAPTAPPCLASAMPAAPTGLTLMSEGAGQIRVSWTKPSGCGVAASYVLEGSANPGGVDTTRSIPASSTTYQGGLQAGTFYMRVRAKNASGVGPASNELQVGGVPGAPSGLRSSIAGSTLTLTWSAPTSGGTASGFIVEMGSAPGLSDLASRTFSADTLSASGPMPSHTAYFRVKAVSVAGTSSASNEIKVK